MQPRHPCSNVNRATWAAAWRHARRGGSFRGRAAIPWRAHSAALRALLERSSSDPLLMRHEDRRLRFARW